jgi:hypothetical protein
MRKLYILSFLLLFTILVFAQNQVSFSLKYPSLEQSPMDMIYFPDNYPMNKTQSRIAEPAIARIIYCRPQKNQRVIFGDLIEYGKVWRLGANEATELELFKEVYIGGKKIPRGRYTLYAIPNPKEWTIIINKDTDTWGAFIYDAKKDIFRIDVPVQNLSTPVEVFTMNFESTSSGANLVMSWENARVNLAVSVK